MRATPSLRPKNPLNEESPACGRGLRSGSDGTRTRGLRIDSSVRRVPLSTAESYESGFSGLPRPGEYPRMPLGPVTPRVTPLVARGRLHATSSHASPRRGLGCSSGVSLVATPTSRNDRNRRRRGPSLVPEWSVPSCWRACDSEEEAALDRKSRGLRAAVYVQLHEDVRDVPDHRLLTDHKTLGDGAVREAVGYQSQHLDLSRRQLARRAEPALDREHGHRRDRRGGAVEEHVVDRLGRPPGLRPGRGIVSSPAPAPGAPRPRAPPRDAPPGPPARTPSGPRSPFARPWRSRGPPRRRTTTRDHGVATQRPIDRQDRASPRRERPPSRPARRRSAGR